MDIEFIEDIAKRYSARKKNVTEEEALDLINIIFKYYKQKLQTNELPQIQIPLVGILYKNIDYKKIQSQSQNITKADRLNEKIFLKSLFKHRPRTEYDHKEKQLIQDHTNNNPIKN